MPDADATDPDGAFVEALYAKLEPLFDPGDLERLTDLARRASACHALRARLADCEGALAAVLRDLVRGGMTTSTYLRLCGALGAAREALEDMP